MSSQSNALKQKFLKQKKELDFKLDKIYYTIYKKIQDNKSTLEFLRVYRNQINEIE